MNRLKTLLILCMALCFATACNKNVDMTLVQKTLFENADIRQIEASDAWEVTVVADSSTFVELEYSAYLKDYIFAKMENDSLKIGFSQKVHPQIGSVFKATVHTLYVNSIEAHNASQMAFEGELGSSDDVVKIELDGASVCNGLQLSGKDVYVSVSDASQFLGFNINSANCVVKVSGASACKGIFDINFHFQAVVNDASQIVAFGGESYYGALTLNNGSLANVVQMPINELSVNLSGASEATVWANDSMVGTLKEASTLYYIGDPQIQIECSEDSQLIPR